MNTSLFESGAKRAKNTANGLQLSLSSLGKLSLAAGVAAVTSLGMALAASARESINLADDMYKASQSLGIGTEELSRLRYAAELSGLTFEQLQANLGKFNRSLYSAAQGEGAAAGALERLGISATDAQGNLKGTTEVLTEIAEAFKGMPDGVEKSALAMEIFGRSGAAMIPFLNMGADGIRELTAEADRFGVVISEETGRDAEAFNDNLARLSGVVSNLGARVAAELLPHLLRFTEWLIDNQDEIVANISKAVEYIGTIIRMGATVAGAIQSMQDRFGGLYRTVSLVLNPLQTLISLYGAFDRARASRNPVNNPISFMLNAGADAGSRLSSIVTSLSQSSLPALETSASNAGGAVRGIGSASSQAANDLRELEHAARETQQLMDRLFPEAAQLRRFREDMSTLGAGGMTPEELRAAQRRLRMELGGVEQGDRGASPDFDDVVPADVDQALRDFDRWADDIVASNDNVGTSFVEMSKLATDSLNQLVSAISGGGVLGILTALTNVAMQLGSAGLFGANFAKSVNSSSFGGARAAGGPVSLGKSYLVGERGPEMFTPGQSGHITPNGGGGSMVQVVPSPYFDVIVDGRIMSAAPALVQAGANAGVSQMSRMQSRRLG
jgi:hypothetical protein